MTDADSAPDLIVLTTLASAEDARRFVRAAVETRVAACGTIVPGTTSIYRWEGALQEETEVLVVLKTRHACWPALARLTETIHPYDVPELLALRVEAGLPAYLDWLHAETAGQEDASS